MVISPLVAFLIGQYIFNGYFRFYDLGITLVNYLIIGGFFWFIAFITNKYSLAIILGNALVFIWSAVNYYVHYFRGNPVLPWDLLAIGTAEDVMLSYIYTPTIPMIVAVIYLIVLSVAVLWSFPKRKFGFDKHSLKARGIDLIIAVLGMAIVFFPDAIESLGAKTDVLDQAGAYGDGGTVAVFFANVAHIDVEEPDGYSPEKVDAIMASVAEEDTEETVLPNIIVIMNESWADFSYYGGLDFSEDLFEEIDAIEGLYRGYTYTSVFGAGTSASEFEFLTGNSMTFLPQGSIPYQQYVISEYDSLASILKEQGYSTMAFHPGNATSWNRDEAYPLLGFDSYKSREDMDVEVVETHGGYVSDASNFDQLIYDFEHRDTSKPWFYFDVTIGSHGGYQDSSYENTVEVVGYEGQFPMAEQYLSLVKETDIAFSELIAYFSTVEEPTIILMFGDHQPMLEEEFLELAYDFSEDQTLEEYMSRFLTPYVVWANYDLDIEIKTVSLNFLGQYLFEWAGVENTSFGNYLLSLSETLPVISFPGYIDIDGRVYPHAETSDYTGLIEEYQIIQYNELFDYDNKRKEYFSLG